MLKYSSVAAILGMLALGSACVTPASAAQGAVIPGGDALDFTPPGDITQKQVQAAPRRDRRKIKAIQNGSYTPHRRRFVAPPERGQ